MSDFRICYPCFVSNCSYAYHLRKWALEGKGVGSHAQLVGEKGAVPIRIVIQPAGYHEKVTLELLSSDYVADLRAEVARWWETIQVFIITDSSSEVDLMDFHCSRNLTFDFSG